MISVDFEKDIPHSTLKVRFEVDNSTAILWGESGSGKTTILNCIAGLLDPDRGEITLEGRTVFSSTTGVCVPPRDRGVGYVFQDYALFPHLSALDNVALALPRHEREQAREWLSRLGLSRLAKRKPADLSGGERQRLALARALATRPRILLLDEPFSALDARTREETFRQFLRLRDELGMSVILVTHSRSEAELLGHRIMRLSEGSLTEYSKPRGRHSPDREASDMGYDIVKAVAASGGGCALITVVSVKGSVPRHVGSKMAVMRDGSTAGTVGGGILEARAVESAAACIAAARSDRLEVELTGSEALGSVPVCGGVAELWIEYVADPAPFAAAAARLEAGKTAVLASARSGGSPALTAVFDATGALVGGRGGAADPAAAAHAAASGQAALGETDGVFYDPILPPERLLILGGGHVGRAVARLASGLGFRVTVGDPRSEFADPSRFPTDVESIEGSFEGTIAGFPFGPSTYALVVSPGHLSDLECARSLLKREYRWAGLIGSKRKVRMILEQLASEGFDRAKVDALAAPVGLDIGAETPEEIAVSILAEMIAVRRASPALASIAADRSRRRG